MRIRTMKQTSFFYFVVTLGVIAALLSFVYGAYFPLRKAQLFIHALQAASGAKTYEEFITPFDKAFQYPSPVGDQEIAKFLINDFIKIVKEVPQEELARTFAEYGETHYFQNDLRHLLTMGHIYSILWTRFSKDEYYYKAEDFYKRALLIGPHVPHVIYTLFELYRVRGDMKGVRDIGSRILEVWPQDESVRRVLDKK